MDENSFQSSLDGLKPRVKELTQTPASKCMWPDKFNSTLSIYKTVIVQMAIKPII